MVDYRGQLVVERCLVACLIIGCVPAWIYGYLQQDFKLAVQGWGAATCLAAIVVLPDWGMFNKNEIKWLRSAKYKSKAT